MDSVEVLAVRVGLVESVAVIVGVLVPAGPVGVPAIVPPALIESPAGMPVAVKAEGGAPPGAVTAAGVYGAPKIPPGSAGGVVATAVPIVVARLAAAGGWGM